MNGVKTVAVVNGDNGVEIIESLVVTSMTHKECIEYINRMNRKMAKMEREYNALLNIATTLERQRNRLLKEKFEIMEEELRFAYPKKLFGRK